MAATVVIERLTGAAPGAASDVTAALSTRANAYDGHSTGDQSNPIKVPTGASSNHSYWVITRLYATGITGTIDNMQWYTDGGSFGTGVSGLVTMCSGYTQATGTQGTTGIQLNATNYSTRTGSFAPIIPLNMFNFTSGSTLNVSGVMTNDPDYSYNVVYQVNVTADAAPGATTARTITWQYDET